MMIYTYLYIYKCIYVYMYVCTYIYIYIYYINHRFHENLWLFVVSKQGTVVNAATLPRHPESRAVVEVIGIDGGGFAMSVSKNLLGRELRGSTAMATIGYYGDLMMI